MCSPRTTQPACHDRGKTARFLTEKIARKGTAGRSGDDRDFDKSNMKGLLYPSKWDFNQRNLGTALTLCFMNIDFTAVFCSIHNLQIRSCSCELNRSTLSPFIHASFYLLLSHNQLSLWTLSATLTCWKWVVTSMLLPWEGQSSWRIHSRDVSLLLLYTGWHRSPCKKWSPSSTQKIVTKIYFCLQYRFICLSQLFISITPCLPRRHSLQRSEAKTFS